MQYKDFRNMEYYEEFGYEGKLAIDFFGKDMNIYFAIKTYDEEIEEIQYESYEKFKEIWNELQKNIAERIIKYYKEVERFSYGPDDKEELKKWWPEIDNIDEVLEQIELDGIIIPSAVIMENRGRCINLMFSKKWGNDIEGNGIGIRIVNEEIVEIGFVDIAL